MDTNKGRKHPGGKEEDQEPVSSHFSCGWHNTDFCSGENANEIHRRFCYRKMGLDPDYQRTPG